MSLVYLNGEFKPIEEASVNVLDRGFIFGDGIYEVIPVFNRKIFRFDEHMRRLETSLNKIYMKSPLSSKELFSIFEQLINSMEEYDHIPGLKEQLSRKIGKLPKLKIDSNIKTLDDVMDLLDADTETIMSKFRLENYNPEPFIPFKVAV